MKDPVHETQQMLGDILNVFVQQAQQPYGHDYGKQTLAGFKEGNSAQTKMFCDQVLLGIHETRAKLHSICQWRVLDD